MRVGLALGGGGVRGLAHVLALETMDACGIRPTHLAGTSMGAIIGALYASGRSGQAIREMVAQHIVSRGDSLREKLRKKADLVRWLSTLRPAWGRKGLLSADHFLHYLLEEIRVSAFEELQIPMKVVATDFYRGEPVVFGSGDLLTAIRASMTLPGIFVPVEHDGKVLVDGGVVNNLPHDLLPDDCDVTIAVDVAPTREPGETDPPNVIEAILGMFDILVERATEERLRAHRPTIYIRPRLIDIPTLDFEKIEEVWEQSRPAMETLRKELGTISSRGAGVD